MLYFLQGLTMGLAYVAPIGVQNLFVINAALNQPRRRALLTALVVVFFDVSLALACFFGVGAVMEAFPAVGMVVLLVGSVIVLAIGIGLLRTKEQPPEQEAEGPRPTSLAKTASTAFVVTWCNPQALIDGTMMLGAFRASLPAGGDLPFICGFGSASVIWFLALSTIVSLLGARFNEKVLNIINKVCGAVIIFYGCKLIWNFVQLMGWVK